MLLLHPVYVYVYSLHSPLLSTLLVLLHKKYHLKRYENIQPIQLQTSAAILFQFDIIGKSTSHTNGTRGMPIIFKTRCTCDGGVITQLHLSRETVPVWQINYSQKEISKQLMHRRVL